MNRVELMDKFCQFLLSYVAPKVSDPLKKFKIGMVAGGVGRGRIEEMAKPLFEAFEKPDGCIDLVGMRSAVKGGFKAAGELPIEALGVTLDGKDAEAFFAEM